MTTSTTTENNRLEYLNNAPLEGAPYEAVTSNRGRPKKSEYFRCSNCGFRKENGHDRGPEMQPEDYCMKCGKKATVSEFLQRTTVIRHRTV